MFTQISPSSADLGETLCSLNFASRVRGVEYGPARKQSDPAESFKLRQMVVSHTLGFCVLFWECFLSKLTELNNVVILFFFFFFFFHFSSMQVEKLRQEEKETSRLNESLQLMQLKYASRENMFKTLQEKVKQQLRLLNYLPRNPFSFFASSFQY